MELIDAQKAQFFTKHIGSLALVKPLIRRMGIAEIIDQLCPADPQQLVSHGRVVELLVANRLVAPTPLYAVEDWARTVGVEELYGLPADWLNDDRLGDTLDTLAPHLPVLKGEIARTVARRFQIGLEHLHWDLTSVHFEGAYEDQTDAYVRITYTKSGKGKPAQKALKVGLNVANDGQGPVPLFYEPLDGNATGFEATLQNMDHLKQHVQVDRLLRISDKGCFSAKIVAETQRQGFDLIASLKWIAPYPALLEAALAAGHTFTPLPYLGQNQARKADPTDREGYAGLEGAHTLLYGGRAYPLRILFIRSDGKVKRAQKTRAKHRAKLEAALQALQAKVGHPHGRNPAKLQPKIEAVRQRYPEGRFLQVTLEVHEGKAVGLQYSWDEAGLQAAARWEGLYALATTLLADTYPMARVFQLFKEQHYVEGANRQLKGPLRVRPVFLQTQARIESVLFILFLALMVYLLVERWYRQRVPEPAGRKTTTRTLLRAFHPYALTVVVTAAGVQQFPNALTPRQRAILAVLQVDPQEIWDGRG